ncbi:hypothetical protein SAMN05443574_103316 [Haloarcula vallismortis]|uniref:Transglutaminase-like domain-containing protein n=2 Tax=Haloarcula vallismortis TaxID=28442 RepID=M0JUE4_HALVA|nr:hypothetical protein [Haloarcula vallismortis]EMA11579.1 hypothetical protein C437_01665 [Haloarcula vallismortis ATCC 29715]SDW45386.1 hypothetical protein SAMN05443574_103316 [Haloarcula vallismortis]
MVNYKQKLRPGKFRYIADEIDSRFHTSTPDEYRNAAVLHKIASEELDYHRSGSTVEKPEKMVVNRSGDCQDQTVLLGSMLLAAGLDIYMVILGKKGEDQCHILPLVHLPETPLEKDTDEVRNTYEELFDSRPSKILWLEVDNKKYYFADSEFSDHIGDADLLMRNYIEETSSGWEFYDKVAEFFVDSSGSTIRTSGGNSSPVRPRNHSGGRVGFFDQIDAAIEQFCEN